MSETCLISVKLKNVSYNATALYIWMQSQTQVIQ